MGLYLPVRTKGSAAIAVCPRCSTKVYYGDLKQDPNNLQFYCADCVDIYDPWRLPPRQAEDISLHHPRPDVPLEDVATLLVTEQGFYIVTEHGGRLSA